MMTNHHPYHSSNTRHRFRCRRGGALLLGVCTGIADCFALDRTLVRIAALLAVWLFTVPTVLAYLLLGYLGDNR
jgi:phage shock protein PspC (stress-responsive transcriptional regulator)